MPLVQIVMSSNNCREFYRSFVTAVCVAYFCFCISAGGQTQLGSGGGQKQPPPPSVPPLDYTYGDLMRTLGVKVSDCTHGKGLLVTILDESKAKLDRQAVVKIFDVGRN